MSINWNKIKYFERQEFDDPAFPGSGKFIDPDILSAINALRIETNWPIIITNAVDVLGKNHARNSFHNKDNGCRAIDFWFSTKASYNQQLEAIIRCEMFQGIGWYPGWYHPGFHVDDREEFLLWKRIGEEYIYWP